MTASSGKMPIPASPQQLAESIGRSLRLPRPLLAEPNRSFTLVEHWTETVAHVATHRITVKPLGYYSTPDAVDIYVFECVMGKPDGQKQTWKIYRRYSQFQRYVSQSTELLSMMVIPRLSQAYMKMFSAKSCKDRLVELHAWLTGVIDNTQAYCDQKELFADPPMATDLAVHAPYSSLSPSISSSSSSSSPPSPPQPSPTSLDAPEALPALILASFLLAGANHPFPHVFRGMPSFAFALEETNVEVTHAPVYPSKLRSSLETTSGLGLRLTASHEQQGKYFGALVSGFLRDATELDQQLAQVQVGSKLVRINGVDVTDEPFDKVLAHLRGAGLPLRLRFLYNPQIQRKSHARSVYVANGDRLLEGMSGGGGGRDARARQGSTVSLSGATHRGNRPRRLSSEASTVGSFATSTSSAMTAATPTLAAASGASLRPTSGSATTAELAAAKRSYSVDARQSMGLFSTVFSDLFGRKRGETTDMLFDNQMEELFSWDDVGGEYQDLISRGFFAFLSQSMLHELRVRRRQLTGESALDGGEEAAPDARAWRQLDQRKGQGIWSTATGPLGLAFGACKLRDVEAAMLEVPPVFFSSRHAHMGSETRLMKGFVLVSVNNESTFGMSFAMVMKMLTKASRPTSVCFRWFKDYSPFLETELAEQEPTSSSSCASRRALRVDPNQTFASSLDCLSESQAELCSSLHLALVENASIRNEIGALQDANRALRRQQEQARVEQLQLEGVLQEKRDRIAKLLQEVADTQLDLRQCKQQLKASEKKLVQAGEDHQRALERAHANAVQKVAEHEERLVKESNKSIAAANVLAERKLTRALEEAMDEMQRQHDEYLQKLAEEHSEEVESLNQQVVVWRHQVEVLTEAEKRNYAAMLHNGTVPYHDFQRTRYGGYAEPGGSSSSVRNYRQSDKHHGGTSGGHGGGGGGGGGVSHAKGYVSLGQSSRGTNQKEDNNSPGWGDHSSPAGFDDRGSSEFSDHSSVSTNPNSNTVWDRVVSLIAN